MSFLGGDFGPCLLIRYQVRELSSHKHNFKKLAQFCLVAVLLFRTRNHDTPFLHIHLRLKKHFRGLNSHPVYICTPPIFCRRKDIWWDGAASGEAGAELVKMPCRKPRLEYLLRDRDFTSVVPIAKRCRESAVR
jgi:hypothetical protein